MSKKFRKIKIMSKCKNNMEVRQIIKCINRNTRNNKRLIKDIFSMNHIKQKDVYLKYEFVNGKPVLSFDVNKERVNNDN